MEKYIFPKPRIQLYALDLPGFPALFPPSSLAGPGFQTPGHLLYPFQTSFYFLLIPKDKTNTVLTPSSEKN